MTYTEKQRQAIIEQAEGKVIAQLEFVEDGEVSYWVMTFKDGSEMSFRFMTELIKEKPCV